MKVNWRAAIFAFLVLVSMGAGAAAWKRSQPPAGTAAGADAPAVFYIYAETANARVGVYLQAIPGKDPGDPVTATLSLSTDSSGVVVLSSVEDTKAQYAPVTKRINGNPQKLFGKEFVGKLPDSLGSFVFSNVESVHKKTFTALLPALAFEEEGVSSPVYSVSDIAGYQPVKENAFRSPGDQPLWEPGTFNATARLQYAADNLKDSRLDAVSPADGVISSRGFVWSGGYGLTPSVQATAEGEVEARSYYEFVAAALIAFGSAAALAFLQEMPRELGWANRLKARYCSRHQPPEVAGLLRELGED